MAKREIPQIKVASRDRLGKRYSMRLRKDGRLPAVVYGHGQDPVHVSADAKEVRTLLHANTHLLNVVLDAKTEPCLIKDVQWDHLGSTIVHVDLARVDLTEKVRVEVEIVITGEAIGLKETGTILETFLQQLEVECLATDIPENIKVDVSHLGVDEEVTVGQIKLPEGVVTTEDPETVVAAVHVLAEEVEPVAAEGTTVEPEVIGKKAEEGAEGEAAAAPAAGGGGKGGEKK
jgi:large subunit ribosomal protein L25